MNAKQKADFIAWIHFFYVVFTIICLPLLFVFTWWHKIVLVFAGVSVLSWIVLRDCWFLQLENKWRKEYNPSDAFENEAYIQHYLKKVFSINCSKRTVRLINQSYMAVLLIIALVQAFTITP